MVKYDDCYYNRVINDNKYKKVEKIYNVSDYISQSKWLCGANIDKFNDMVKSGEKSLITLGLGINGIPHLGTVSQILKMIYLQKMGYYVQIVLGDLDVYGARDQDLSKIKELVLKYKEFIEKLGFDNDKGEIRNQFDHDKVLKTAYLISTSLKDCDFLDCKEDIYELYEKLNLYPGMEYSVKQSIALMFADFIDPGYRGEFKNVLVMCGIDEHVYPKKAIEIVNRMGINMNLGGIYSKVIPGLNGYPKMSKSLKNSGILLTDSKETINNMIIGESDNYNVARESILFQIIMNTSLYDEETLKYIENECNSKTNEWQKIKKMYANDLYNMTKMWK